MLSYTSPAVTLAEADAYAAPRLWSEWIGPNDVKSAAIRRGQDFIASRYNARWAVVFDDASAPDEVKQAIILAARAEIAKPGSLAGSAAASAVITKERKKVEGIERELEFKDGALKDGSAAGDGGLGKRLDGLLSALINTEFGGSPMFGTTVRT